MLRDFLWTKMHTKSYNVTPGQKFKFCENKFLVKVYKSCKNLYSLEKLVRRKKSPKVFLQSLKRAAILKAPKGKSASLDFPLQLQKHVNKQSQNNTVSFSSFSIILWLY